MVQAKNGKFTSAFYLWTVRLDGTSYERTLIGWGFGTFRWTRSIGRCIAFGRFSAGWVLWIYTRRCTCGDRNLIFTVTGIITRIAKWYRTNLWCTLNAIEMQKRLIFWFKFMLLHERLLLWLLHKRAHLYHSIRRMQFVVLDCYRSYRRYYFPLSFPVRLALVSYCNSH